MLYEKGYALVFEVTQGCVMGCLGCQINKNLSGLPSEDKLDELLALFHGLKESGAPMAEFEFGPTDFIKANNRQAIFEHHKVRQLANLFEMITLNASFVHKDVQEYVQLAHDVNRLNESEFNGLQIPLNLKHIFSEGYFELIERNLEAYRSTLIKPLKEVIFTVIVDELGINHADTDLYYSRLFERTAALKAKGYGFDFISHHGLGNLSNRRIRDDFLKTIRKLNLAFYEEVTKRGEQKQRRYDTLKNFTESVEVVFHEGELYLRAAVNEKSNVFHERMRYDDAWTAPTMQSHIVQRFNTNLEWAAQNPNCAECSRMTDCAKRFIQDIMSITDTQQCLIGLKHIPLPV